MPVHVDKVSEKKNRAIDNSVTQQKSSNNAAFSFNDNRSDTVAQRKLKDIANNSPQVQQSKNLQAMADGHVAEALQFKISRQNKAIEKKANRTGLPDQLKMGVENLSRISMDDVKVHYNSAQPAQLQAHAYAQGTDIYIAPGQEEHLPHEAWHVVQQKQGRVKPTMQMKVVGVNDDKGLEREADVMGAKAISQAKTKGQVLLNTSPVGQTTQLVVNANSFQELLAEQLALGGVLATRNARAKELLTPSDKELPAFDLNKLYDKISKAGLNIPGKEELPVFIRHFINNNKAGVEAYDFPEADWDEFAGWLDGEVGKKQVTAGFEFEFSTMAKGNPFEGITHVELSESPEKINNVPFKLETDASNALELVTPPMFFDAINSDIPLPKPEDAGKVDAMIKARLLEISEEDKAMKAMADAFKADPGLTFDLKDAEVTPKSLSDRSFGKFTKDKHTVDRGAIEGIGVGKISKYGHGGIDSQINIATDAASYVAFVELNMANREKNPYVRQFYDLQAHLESAINIERYRDPLKGFLRLFVRNIAGQLAVPSMQMIFKKQTEAFNTGKTTKGKLELEFEFYAWASSGVKDIGNMWIKDNIINIGMGMLNKEAWGIVHDLIASKVIHTSIHGFKVPAYLTDMVSDKLEGKAAEKEIQGNRKTVGAYYVEAKSCMENATKMLGEAIEHFKLDTNDEKKGQATPDVGFMEHNKKFISPRQDTHVHPDKVQLPAWKQRLHVTEIRSNPVEGLAAWTIKAMEKKETEERLRLADEESERTDKPYQKYNKLLTKREARDGEIKITDKAHPDLEPGEYETIKKRLGKMNDEQRGAAMAKAKDLAWNQSAKYPYVAKALAKAPDFNMYDQNYVLGR